MKPFNRQLALAALATVGVCTWNITASVAQNTQPKKPASTSQGSQNQGNREADAPSMGTSAVMMDDAEFLKQAYEGGLAEIEMGRLAQEKASSEKVKSYGQKMIDVHTTANQEIASLVTGKGGLTGTGAHPTVDAGSGSGAVGSGTGATGTNNPTVGTGAGSTTNAGSNVPKTGNNASNPTGTAAGSTGSGTGATGSTNTTTGTNSSAGSNTGMTNGSGTAANPTVGSTDTARAPRIGNAAGGMGTGSMAVDGDGPMASPEIQAKAEAILSTELNAEHQALKARLSKLSGAAFDRQYLQAMVKDHTKMLRMVSAKAEEKADSPSAAQQWARKHEGSIREHLEDATKLTKDGSK